MELGDFRGFRGILEVDADIVSYLVSGQVQGQNLRIRRTVQGQQACSPADKSAYFKYPARTQNLHQIRQGH